MRRPGALALLLVLLAAGLPAPARAYVRSTTSSVDPAPIAWDLANTETALANVVGGEVVYSLHPAGSADVTDGSDQLALERAFRAWSGISGSALAFARGPDFANTTVVFDQEYPVFWVETSTTVDQGTPDPGDDVSVAGALAVTFTFRRTGGPEVGEIVDSNIVFNGVDNLWTTDPVTFPGRFDIEAVGTHEIGHSLGLDHSSVAAATMFPRTSAGRPGLRSPSADDVAGAVDAYPGGNSAANRGSLTGFLRRAGFGVFGGLVWLRDADGVMVGQGITQPGGSFRIEGLPPGNYTAFARPASDPALPFFLFSESNLRGIYSGLERTFLPTAGVPVTIDRGATTAQDLTAADAPLGPPMDILLIGRGSSFGNIPRTLRRGETGIAIGVAGPGLPNTGTPLSITGSGITVTGTMVFGTVGGFPAMQMTVSVAADAPLGPRDLVVVSGTDLVTAIGGVEILFPATAGVPGEAGLATAFVPPLRLEVVGTALDLTWGPAPGADSHRLYRGNLDSLRLATPVYDHAVVAGSCHLSVTDASLSADVTDGIDHYYLVTGVNQSGEGSAGADFPGGLDRPLPAPTCP